MNYRIMVIGEDHTEFCYETNLQEEELSDELTEAEEDYPCGYVYVEEMR